MNAESQPNCHLSEAEPASAMTTVPIWLVMTMLVFLFLGAWYFDARGGWFEPKVYRPYTSIAQVDAFQPHASNDPLPQGKRLFEANCALCHNSDGMGKPLQAPPLAGSEWVLAPGVNRLIRIPQVGLTGSIKVKGQEWNLTMAGMGAMYSDDDLAAVLSYIRNAWNNKAALVTADQVKKVRAELGNRSQAETVDELNKLAE